MPRAPEGQAHNRLIVGGLLLLLTTAAAASPWSEVRAPSRGPTVIVGGASNGCISGAQALPASGPGYVSIRRERNRFYSHPETIRFVKDLGEQVAAHGDRLMMVGDLSQPRGGLMSTSHVSHQNGLDVDIWMTPASSPEEARRRYPEDIHPVSMVVGEGVGGDFGDHPRFLIKTAAQDPRVDRILVNPAIKRALCRGERADRGWLRKLRPWWGHDAHFHVRTVCPPGSPSCDQQSPIPPGDGCGAQLDWWFSAEARTPSKQGKPKPRPPLPTACRAVLTAP